MATMHGQFDIEMDSPDIEELQAQVEEWSSNSNECFTVKVIRGDGETAAEFQPDFTYPIFGEDESIFGYQDLSITLSFAAHNLQPHVSIKHKRKFVAEGEIQATDIPALLQDLLPETAFSEESTADVLRDKQAAEWRPPGEKVDEYSKEGSKYEIWCASLSDSRARELVEKMQVLVPMFIEGGSMLQLEQDWSAQRWKLFLLYQITPKHEAESTYSPYSLLGYATTYRIFTFADRQNPPQSDLTSTQSLYAFLDPDTSDTATTSTPHDLASPLDLPSRERLSQFLILPPYQGAGHGQQLYNTLYTHLTSPPNVSEFTVEDPSEAFDDLRDLADLLHLRAHNPDFAALRINTSILADQLQSDHRIPTDLIIPIAIRDKIRSETKIMPRQFDRLVEMHTLSFIPQLHRSRSRITRKEKASNEHDRAYYFWRMYAKQRLFLFNRDQLIQVEQAERVEKLEAALDGVLEGYAKMVEKLERREKAAEANGHGSGDVVAGAPRVREGKRKVIDEDEDEDDEAEEDDGEVAAPPKAVAVNGHKKVRVQ